MSYPVPPPIQGPEPASEPVTTTVPGADSGPMTTAGFSNDALDELARRHGTPCFVYRIEVAERAWRELRRAMPGRVRLAYAVKANPHGRLLAALGRLGASFDCASIGELERVADLSLEPGRILFAGPGKRRHEIAKALALGARIQAESWEDLQAVDELATRPVDVNLRVHPIAAGDEDVRIIGGSGPSAFGIDEEDVPALLDRARSLPRVRIRGLHVFTASNELRASRLLETYRQVLDLGRRLQHDHGLDLQQIDLGGGLGITYDVAESPLDLAALGAGVNALLDEQSWFGGELILEPGRFLAAECGIYLCRVVRLKTSRGTRFAILEGGINHLLRPHLTGQPFPVTAPRRRGNDVTTTLAGPLCTSLDRLGEVPLPDDLEAGDLLVFGKVGAYGFSEGMTHFLSHPEPPEVVVEGPPVASRIPSLSSASSCRDSSDRRDNSWR